MKSTPVRGVKEILKSCAFMQSEGASLTACLLEYDPTSYPWWPVKGATPGATAKARLQEAASPGVDPKPLELPMARVKRP